MRIVFFRKISGLSLLLLLLTVTRANNPVLRKELTSTSASRNEYSFGIDISRYQTINWDHIDTNLHFIICKATEGTSLVDPTFYRNWSKISADVKKGAYHFFRPGVDGKAQADHFLRTVPLEKGNLLPVIDVEYCRAYSRTKPAVYTKNLKDFVRRIEEVICQKPIIYTNPAFWNRYFKQPFKGMEKEYHLWIADYRFRDEPVVPGQWQDWSIWQHSCRGNVLGIHNEVDLNICKVHLDSISILD